MNYTAAVLEPEHWDRIDELLADRPACAPSMHYTSAWGRVLVDTLGDEPVYLAAEDASGALAAYMPAVLHRNEAGNHIASLPIHNGYGGVFAARDIDEPAAYATVLEALNDLAAQHRCVTATIVTNPLAERESLYHRLFKPDFTFDRFTQAIDIGPDYRYNQKKRNQINRLKRYGVEVKLLERLEGDNLAAWLEGYTAAKRALDVPPKPVALWQAIDRHLAGMARYVTAWLEGELIGGILVVINSGIAEYYESWFDDAFSKINPTSLCVDAAIRFAIESGCNMWNWEASPKRGDGVYEFKRKWGSRDIDYKLLTRKFGAIERWRQMGRQELAKRYPWYFVAPYDEL